MTTTITTRRFVVIAKHLANREAFRTHGAMRSESVNGGQDAAWMFARGYGRLPQDWARTLTARRGVITYVIYSYQTPIAWRDSECGWVVPDERYSQTTSVHQGRIRAALTYNGETYAE